MDSYNFRDYLEFISGVLLFRTRRDLDDFPETWLEREVPSIKVSDFTDEEKQELLMLAKFADLIDNTKQWLLEEIEEDLREAHEALPQAA